MQCIGDLGLLTFSVGLFVFRFVMFEAVASNIGGPMITHAAIPAGEDQTGRSLPRNAAFGTHAHQSTEREKESLLF